MNGRDGELYSAEPPAPVPGSAGAIPTGCLAEDPASPRRWSWQEVRDGEHRRALKEQHL